MSNKSEWYLSTEDARKERRVFSLWICDVHTMLHCPQLNTYYFQGLHVPYVRIFGTIVSAVPFPSSNTHRYEVDDGTGTITCIYNLDWQLDRLTNRIIDNVVSDFVEAELSKRYDKKKTETEEAEETSKREQAEKSCSDWFCSAIREKSRRAKVLLQPGDSVCCIGQVRYYDLHRELRVCQLYRISSLEEETGLILQFVDLYKAYSELKAEK